MGSSPVNSSSSSPVTSLPSVSVLAYIHRLSGQSKKSTIIESEHSYSKCWNRHPDPSIKSRPAKFLFMGSFVRQVTCDKDANNEIIDVESLDEPSSLLSSNPLVAEFAAATKTTINVPDDFNIPDSVPNKSAWSPMAQRLWAKILNILYSDRLIRLTIEGSPNEFIIKKMLANRCANKLRHLFASMAYWDANVLSWLHSTLLEHVSGHYLTAYHEAMAILRQKVPALTDRFYNPSTNSDLSRGRNKGPTPDPIQNVLNNYKPKRIKSCPLFILVPNGPQVCNSITPQRLKHWQILFASLGKIITLSINYRPTTRVKECLNEILNGVGEKIKECRTTFTEGRPIVLVGFGHSSLIAAHSALDNAAHVTATICLGFPLTGVNGFRGDLDDPLLETTVPTMFIIGQNSTMSSIDDMEDFRERITKAETGLVVVGGANDNLVVSQTKQRFAGITQAIVDRCIADEIYDFINYILNPHYVPSDNNNVSTPLRQTALYRSFSPSLATSTPSSTLGATSTFSSNLTSTSNNRDLRDHKDSHSNVKNGTGPKPRGRRRKKIDPAKPEETKKETKSETDATALTQAPEPAVESKEIQPPTTHKKKRDSGGTCPPLLTAGASMAVASISTPILSIENETPTHSTKRKREEESSMSISSLEKIEQTLDEVISGYDISSSPSPNPSTPAPAESNNSMSEKPQPVNNSNYFGRHYDFSYDVSEVATFTSLANTRTRQIRAPKQLDM